MTFLEAAIEVLRREGKALHFKELTRLAIKYDLLSVVGRDPEQMMQTRLQAEVRRPTSELTRVSPGVFGLRGLPARPGRSEATKPPREPAAAQGGAAASGADAAASAPAAAEGPGGGKRRRGRDRGPGKAAPAAAAKPASPAAEAAPPAAEVTPASAQSPAQSSEPSPAQSAAPESAAAASTPAAPAAPAEPRTGAANGSAASGPGGPGPGGRDRDRDRGRGGRRRRGDRRGGPGDAAVDAAPEAAPEQLPLAPAAASPAAPESAPPPPSASSSPPISAPVSDSRPPREPQAPPPQLHPRTEGPALMPVAAGEPVLLPPPPSARTPQPPLASPSETPVPPKSSMTPVPTLTPSAVLPPPPPITAPPPGVRPGGGPGPGQGQGQAPAQAQAQGPAGEAAGSPRVMAFADAAYDVLRGSSDGRPIHFRQIAEIAIKRRLLRGDVADVARAMRGALVREQRQRDSDGLRPRIRNMGQGQFSLGERKLEPELYGAERDMLDRVNRTREATRVALRRRLRVMPPGPFELLMRLLMEKLGFVGAELVKRGEGVAYYGGTCNRGSRSVKLLCAVRPGENEVSREAVGELRAGVRLRNYDEGLMLCGGRLSSTALAEAGAQPGIDVYDQDALTDLLIRFQLGVRRMLLPLDYLDTELFNELLDQS